MAIEFEGLDDIIGALSDVVDDINDAVRRGVEIGGKIIQSECKAQCPVDTGELRDSITEQTSGGNLSYVSEIGPTADYGIYVEMGTGIYATGGAGRQDPWRYQDAHGQWHTTRGQPPQPYMEPGFEAAKGEAREALEAEIRKAVN